MLIPIIKKELKLYFNSPSSYIFLTVFLIFTAWLFFNFGGFFITNQASMRYFFILLPWVFLFLIPAVTMRLWAEEKKIGTMEVLLTMPVNDKDVVIGKFLASFLFLVIALVCTITIPIIILNLGEPDIGVIIASYIGSLFLVSAYLAIGLFVSSITKNQIISFIIALAISFLLFIIGEEIVLNSIPDVFVPIFRYLGLGSHFYSISRGVIDSRDIIYYLSVIFIFLYLNVKVLENRKYSN